VNARRRVLITQCLLIVLSSCRTVAWTESSPVQFRTATAWIHQDSDSTALRVEIARSEAQHELGLSRRAFLNEGLGMLFQFDRVRSRDEGFWMLGVQVPLDIAFIDREGLIQEVLPMDVCQSEVPAQSCPGYFPAVEYSSALETNQGWFERNGIYVGAVVVVGP